MSHSYTLSDGNLLYYCVSYRKNSSIKIKIKLVKQGFMKYNAFYLPALHEVLTTSGPGLSFIFYATHRKYSYISVSNATYLLQYW